MAPEQVCLSAFHHCAYVEPSHGIPFIWLHPIIPEVRLGHRRLSGAHPLLRHDSTWHREPRKVWKRPLELGFTSKRPSPMHAVAQLRVWLGVLPGTRVGSSQSSTPSAPCASTDEHTAPNGGCGLALRSSLRETSISSDSVRTPMFCRIASGVAGNAEVYRAVYDIELLSDSGGRLLIPEWSGVALSAYLESDVASEAEKLGAIRLAARSLSRLHGITIEWPDGKERPLSHGDATVQNAIVDSGHTTASWLDFDTIHESSMDDHWRHADDLRAFTYSAAERVDAGTFPALTKTIVENYRLTAPLDALAEAVAYWRARPISFHLAQARIGYRKRQLLDEALLDSLRCRGSGSAT